MKKQRLAKEIERKIRTELEQGRFQFARGWAQHHKDKQCVGCAVAACAWAVGGYNVSSHTGSGTLPAAINKVEPMLLESDVAQLEMGFERFTKVIYGVFNNKDGSQPREYLPDCSHPFYRLGSKFRAEFPEATQNFGQDHDEDEMEY